MKLGEIIQRIQSLYSKGVQSDDTRLSDRHIYNKVLSTRAKLLIQKSNKKQKINQYTYQTLPSFELEKIENKYLYKLNKYYRSIEKIPVLLSNFNHHSIQLVSTLDNQIIFSETTLEQATYKKSGARITKDKPDFFIHDEYIYLTSVCIPKFIKITALFFDPISVQKLIEMQNNQFDEYIKITDRDFPIDESLIDDLIELSSLELINQFSKGFQDINNNTSDLPV